MSNVIEIDSQEDWDLILQNNENVVLKFWATWCGPCRNFAPHFDKASQLSDEIFVSVDVDKFPEIAQEYGVRSIPAVKQFIGGEFHQDITPTTVVKLLGDMS